MSAVQYNDKKFGFGRLAEICAVNRGTKYSVIELFAKTYCLSVAHKRLFLLVTQKVFTNTQHLGL